MGFWDRMWKRKSSTPAEQIQVSEAKEDKTEKISRPVIAFFAKYLLGSTGSFKSGRREFTEECPVDLDEIRRAYVVDSYIRQSVDKYVDLIFKAGWVLDGKNPDSIKYIKQRLQLIADATSKPTEILLRQLGADLVKYDNVFIVLKRQEYKNNSYRVRIAGVGGRKPIAGLFFMHPASVRIVRDDKGNIVKYKQVPIGNKMLLSSEKDYPQFSPDEVLHIYSSKENGFAFGVPYVSAAIEDVKVLRVIEENVARLTYRMTFPFVHVKVGNSGEGQQAHEEEIDAYKKEIESQPVDATLVTNERVSIDIKGVEGEALDVDKYLGYFEQRTFTGLAVSGIQMGRANCYDEETQTLTDGGWKYYWEVNENDKIATFNPITQKVEFHIPCDGHDKHIYQYSGKMYHFKSPKHIDVMVSAEHEMWVCTDRMALTRKGFLKWKKIKAKELYEGNWNECYFLERTLGQETINCSDKIRIPEVKSVYNGSYNNTILEFDAGDFARFLGYYISEGCTVKSCNRHYPIVLSQNPGPIFDDMCTTLERMGLKYNVRMVHGRTKEITIFHKSLYYYLKEDAGSNCYSKRIPREILEYSPRVLQELLEALVLGDGSIDKHGSYCYYTVNDQLADDVQELAVRLGHEAKVIKTRQTNRAIRGRTVSSQGFIYRTFISMGRRGFRYFKKEYIKEVDYNGTIYCYNVPNHLFITRRNGKIAIHGNTANRSTSDTLSTELHDKVKSFQKVISTFWNELLIKQLLLEGGYDFFSNPDYLVFLTFKEIELDAEIKTQAHSVFLYEHGAIDENELRRRIGLEPVVDSERDRMHLNVITIPKLRAAAMAKFEAGGDGNPETDNIIQPANQHGKRSAPKIGKKESIEKIEDSITVLSQKLSLYYDDLINDLIYTVSKGKGTPVLYANLTRLAMKKSLTDTVYLAFRRGVERLNSEMGSGRYATTTSSVGSEELRRYVDKYLDKFSGDVEKVCASTNGDEVKSKLETMRYRLHFMADQQVKQAYWLGYARAAEKARNKVELKCEDKCCGHCEQMVGILTEATIDSVPAHHPGCKCKLEVIDGK